MPGFHYQFDGACCVAYEVGDTCNLVEAGSGVWNKHKEQNRAKLIDSGEYWSLKAEVISQFKPKVNEIKFSRHSGNLPADSQRTWFEQLGPDDIVIRVYYWSLMAGLAIGELVSISRCTKI